MKHIIGWQRIRISLAVFFATLERRPNGLTPFNIFLSGLPGTAKTEGAKLLAEILGKTVAIVDSSTLDDIAELAGVIDIHANRAEGKNQIILGDLLKADILILDEFLNTRAHVLSQFRLLLQGKLTICGNTVPMQTKAIIGTANLTKDMLVGSANEVDSPTADRWALIVEVPALDSLSSGEIDAIINDQPHGDFAGVLKDSVAGILKHIDGIEGAAGQAATLYVRTLVSSFSAGSPFASQGRRAKLLKSFVLAAMALCEEEPELELDDTVWQVVRDCMTYHRLSGLDLSMADLQSAHKLALAVLNEALNNSTEAFIAAESNLSEKVKLTIQGQTAVTAITKAEVFSQVAASNDLPLITACRVVLQSPWGSSESPALAELLRSAMKPSAEFFANLEGMGQELIEQWPTLSPQVRWQWWSRWLTASYSPETNSFMAKVRRYLQDWEFSLPTDLPEPAA